MTPEELAKRLQPEYAQLRRDLMQRIVLVAESNVKRITPVRTGNLRRSITSRVESSGERGFVGTNVRYAPPVEARSHMFERGLENSRDTIERLAQEAGEELFVRVSR